MLTDCKDTSEMKSSFDIVDDESKNDGKESKDFILRRRKLMKCAKSTIESASKLLRKKIPCTGHLMTPRSLWIHTVPTKECDVVVMLSGGAEDASLIWLLGRLRASSPGPGLVVHLRHHLSSDSYGFYLTAPFKILLKAAEEVHLPKILKSENGGGLKEFLQSDAQYFQNVESEKDFFSSQERQYLVLHLLQTLRMDQGDTPPGLRLIDGQAIIPKCESAGIISQIFPLHDLDALRDLQNEWVRSFLKKQPLDKISNYFGVKIAMYFAWLGHYTTALIVPAVIGCGFSIGFGGSEQGTDVGFVLFSFFNVFWFSVYLEAWKRYSAELAYKWGTLDQRDELLVEPRPLFTGPLQISPVTGRLEATYPAWKRYVFRYLVTVPVIVFCLIIVFIVMMLNLKLQDWWDKQIEERGYAFYLSYLPKIMLAVGITLLDEAYYKVACWLNDKENYRLETKYENHLIVKVALTVWKLGETLSQVTSMWVLWNDRGRGGHLPTGQFQFVNSFLSLFYIAFYLQDQEKLKEQLAALLIARQVIGNLKESLLPYLMEQVRLAKMSFQMFGALSPSEATHQTSPAPHPTRNITQAELESSLFKYDGTFADHLEMFIQLGYVVLFSSAFPLAALCALINNLVEMRSDAFKLCFIFQRPFGQRVPNIGTWQNAMEVMGLIAVLVNCALIGLSGHVHRMFPEMSTTQTILLIVALEHLMLVVRLVVKVAIPDLPEWVATEMAKVEFGRREAMRNSGTPGSRAPVPNHSPVPSPPPAPIVSTKSVGRFVVSSTSSSAGCDGSEPTEKTSDLDNKKEAREVQEPEGLGVGEPEGGEWRRPRARVLASTWSQPLSHHHTIHHTPPEWIRKLKVESGRKTSEPEMGGAGLVHPSIDFLSLQKETSSDSDLLRSDTDSVWTRHRFPFSPTSSSVLPPSEEEKQDDILAKKKKIKQSFMKRARSVAVFSLKLKEKRAAAEAKVKEKPPALAILPVEQPSGEMSCIPIEKIISVDDVATGLRRTPSFPSNS